MSPSVIPSRSIVNLQHAFKLALSVVLLYWLALRLDWDLPKYGALAIVLVSLDTTGASMSKGIMRIVGTTVGLAIGLVGLALFAQHGWLMLVYQTFVLAVVGYFMQSSRYPYAWFVAGFLSPLVWATTYGNIDSAFSYATFRYLETTAGIVIYTVVGVVLWPRTAGEALKQQGDAYWQQFQDLFAEHRRQWNGDPSLGDASARQAKLAGAESTMLSLLDAAYLDTSSIAEQKRVWESFRINLRATGNAMEVWRQSIGDCQHLDLDTLLPNVDDSLEILEQRMIRIADLWQVRFNGQGLATTADRDEGLLERNQVAPSGKPYEDLAAFDRAALLNFSEQLNSFDRISIELFRTLRVLARIDKSKVQNPIPSSGSSKWLPRWDAENFPLALVPPLSFIVAWIFWIYFNPPTGPSVPSMAATYGLMVVMTRVRVMALILPALIIICGFVGPIYFLVMPRLSTGPELLTFIFLLVFTVSATMVVRLSLLKTLVLLFFVMMTGISNNQSYSFEGLVAGAQMLLLSMLIVGWVQTIVFPAKSERVLLDIVHRFFRGCARITNSYSLGGPSDRTASFQTVGKQDRERCLETIISPASAKIQAAHQHLDDKRYPDNSPEKVKRLIDSVQSVSNRLHALEQAHQQIFERRSRLPESINRVVAGVQGSVQAIFNDWANLETGDMMEQRQGDLHQLACDVELQISDLKAHQNQLECDDGVLRDVYFLVGSIRGLIDAMKNTQVVINDINWQQWATPRF